MWLVWIDAISKYGGVERVKSANGFSTVCKLTKVFSLIGNLDNIVFDIGTQFTLDEFRKFNQVNGIRHMRCAPYLLSTNEKAERFVQVF